MKKLASVLVLSAATGLLAISSSAQITDGHCSNADLRGDYAFRVSGEIFAAAGVVNRDGIALTHFDGDHTLVQVDYVLANGVPVMGPADANGFHDQETGTYQVNANCTGNAEIDFPTPPQGTSGAVIKLFFVLSDDGRQLNTIVTSITPPNTTTPVPANIHSDATKVHDERIRW